MDEAYMKLEQEFRRQQAIHNSNIVELRQNLLDASNRFKDLAELMEKDNNYRPINFMKTSAERYKWVAENN